MATKPTKVQLARLCELKSKKSGLESEARALETEIDKLTEVCCQYLDDIEKDTAKVNGYQLTYVPGQARVAWKEEFVDVMGAEAAAELQKSAPRPPRLVVVPPKVEEAKA